MLVHDLPTDAMIELQSPEQCRAYDPNRLFDALLRNLNLEDDEALSRRLNISRSLLFRIRCGESRLGAGLLIRISEHCGIPVAELRRLAGDRRQEYRLEESPGAAPASSPSLHYPVRRPADESLVRDDPGLPSSVQWA